MDGVDLPLGWHMKLAALAVSLLVAVIAAGGTLLSQTSRSTVPPDRLVQELSQKIQEQDAKLSKTEEALRQLSQEQDAKLSKTEEALRQLSSDATGPIPQTPDRSNQLSRVGNLQTKMQQVDKEDYRLGLLHDQISKEQARLDAWQKQSDLTKHRLDQDEKVLGLEVMVKAVDDRNSTKPQAPQFVAVVAPNASKLPVDLHGETPFEFPSSPAVHVAPPDYSSLQERHTQLQTERKQWALDKQALVQSKSQLSRQITSYNNEFQAATKKRKKLEDEARVLKSQGLALRAKS